VVGLASPAAATLRTAAAGLIGRDILERGRRYLGLAACRALRFTLLVGNRDCRRHGTKPGIQAQDEARKAGAIPARERAAEGGLWGGGAYP